MADNQDILKPRIKYTPKLPKVDPNLLLHAEDLLHYYSFDLGSQSATIVLQQWAERYSVQWIRLAIIEALYQGRYKAVSVAQILQLWTRRQQAQPRFDPEFEKLICEKLPRKLLLRNSDSGESAIAALAAEIHASKLDPNVARRATRAENGTSTQEAALAALARVVQNRKALQPSVNAVINQVEANVETMAAQAKQQVRADGVRATIALNPIALNHSQPEATGNPDDAADRPATDRPELGIGSELTIDLGSPHPAIDRPLPESPLTAIHQFTPNPLSPELLAKWKAVAAPSSPAPMLDTIAPVMTPAIVAPCSDAPTADTRQAASQTADTSQTANTSQTPTPELSNGRSVNIIHPSADISQPST